MKRWTYRFEAKRSDMHKAPSENNVQYNVVYNLLNDIVQRPYKVRAHIGRICRASITCFLGVEHVIYTTFTRTTVISGTLLDHARV